MFHDDEREYFIWLSHAAMAFCNQSAFLLYFYISIFRFSDIIFVLYSWVFFIKSIRFL